MDSSKKICSECFTQKSTSDFYRHETTKDKLTPRCKSCILAQNKSRREKNKLNPKIPPKEKSCGGCGGVFTADLFCSDAGTADKLGFLCKQCARAKSRKRRAVELVKELDVTEKTCNDCLVTMPISCFYKCAGTPNGLQYKCKSCSRKRNQSRLNAMRDREFNFDQKEQKRCRKCKAVKMVADFGRNRTTKDGFNNECRSCVKKHDKERHEKNKLSFSINNIPEFSSCYACKLVKHKQNFRIDKTKTKGISGKCRSCESEYNSKRMKENPMIAVAASHRRRVKQRAAKGELTADKIYLRFEFYENKCYYCGEAGKMTADHRIPIFRGGSNWPSNIVPACKACNSRKHTKTEMEFREWLIGYRQ